jgi:hypothetical protein
VTLTELLDPPDKGEGPVIGTPARHWLLSVPKTSSTSCDQAN